MPCGGAKREPRQIVQITVDPKLLQRTKKVASNIEDFHCPECGLTLRNRSRNYFHRCPGAKPVDYQISRLRICSQCPMNQDDICVEYKRLHPDRDCVISVGVKMLHAACPLGRWSAVGRHCERCGRFNFSTAGVAGCNYCGHGK